MRRKGEEKAKEKRGKEEGCLKRPPFPFLFNMGRMRWGERVFLLSGLFLVLLGFTAQAKGFLMKEIRTFGRQQIAIDLDGRAEAKVSVLASDQSGRQLVFGKVYEVETQDGSPPQRFGPLVGNRLNLARGQRKRVNVYYDGNNYKVPVVIRAWASQGTILNAGRLIVTDNKDNPRGASFRYELSARGSLPTWQFLLGFALWFVPGGQPLTPILWGSVSNTGSTTIVLDRRETKTIYYTYTGCSAAQDYNDSFTLDPRYVPAGQAIVLNIQGWCGGLGVGNWARVSQAVAVPPDFYAFATTPSGRVSFAFGTPNRRVFDYHLYTSASVYGPDDCGGYYTDPYPNRDGRSINFAISGADCAYNIWGLPGKPGVSYSWLPNLTLIARAWPGGWRASDGSSAGPLFDPGVPYQYSPSWREKRYTYSPTPFFPGDVSTTPVSYQLPDGTVGSTNVVQFSPHGYTDGMAIVSGRSTGTIWLPDLIIPPRSPKCTFKNDSSETLTVYLLDPPGTYSPSSLLGGTVPAQASQLPPGASANYPPGFYLVQDSSGRDYPHSLLNITGCVTRSSFEEEAVSISPGFLAY